MALRITGRRGKDGRNSRYRLSNKEVISVKEGVSRCNKGKLPGYHSVKGKYLRDNPDKNKKDNINSQPKI